LAQNNKRDTEEDIPEEQIIEKVKGIINIIKKGVRVLL
jgi:hypothetical protein